MLLLEAALRDALPPNRAVTRSRARLRPVRLLALNLIRFL